LLLQLGLELSPSASSASSAYPSAYRPAYPSPFLTARLLRLIDRPLHLDRPGGARRGWQLTHELRWTPIPDHHWLLQLHLETRRDQRPYSPLLLPYRPRLTQAAHLLLTWQLPPLPPLLPSLPSPTPILELAAHRQWSNLPLFDRTRRDLTLRLEWNW
ncbi:MAG: hypothetical protein N2557_07930, partial [Hydrogenophilus sp.]|nr:hypothetical protein [Hydrogenophilus sp.]